jgi:branched-chain amino acid transport system substrate-binding protein
MVMVMILGLTAIVFAGPYAKPEHGITADEVKIGASLPLSGSLASMGKSVDEGLQVYLSMVNESGGINGRKINCQDL